MMTQSVMTQAARLFGNASGSVASKGKQAGTGFELFIDSTINSTESIGNNKTSPKRDNLKSDATDKNADRADTAESKKATVAAKTQEAEESKYSKDSKVKDVGKNYKTTDTERTEELKDSEKVEKTEPTNLEELMAQFQGLLQTIKDIVMNKLSLTSEELDQLLEEQQMGLLDLLQSENLQKLILANSGATDIFTVLTDENLEATMKELLSEVEAAKQTMELSPEQVKKVLEQLESQAANQPELTGEMGVSQKEQEKGNLGLASVASEDDLKELMAVNARKEDQSTISSLHNEEDASFHGMVSASDTTEGDASARSGKDDSNHDLNPMDQFQMFVENLTKASTNTQVDFSGNMVQVTELRDIANQIIERIKVAIAPDQASMELQLNPEHLGKVNLTIQSKDGVMTAQFVVQNEISKEAIESQLGTLRETLTQQGIKVEAIEVTVSAYAFEQNAGDKTDSQPEEQKKSSGRGITLEEAMSMTEAPEEARSEAIDGITGSQIDYTA